MHLLGTFVLVFSAFYAFMFGLGWKEGAKDSSEEWAVKKIFLDSVEVVKADEKYFISLEHTDLMATYIYSIDEDKLFKGEAASIQKSVGQYRSYAKRRFQWGDLAAYLGGPAVGYTLKDLIESSPKKLRKHLIPGFLGTVSGYRLGWEKGLHSGLSESAFLDFISDTSNWIEMEAFVFYGKISEAELILKYVEGDNFSERRKMMDNFIEVSKILNRDAELGYASEDFAIVEHAVEDSFKRAPMVLSVYVLVKEAVIAWFTFILAFIVIGGPIIYFSVELSMRKYKRRDRDSER